MHEENNDNKIPLDSLDETLDKMFFGYDNLRDIRVSRALELRKRRKGGIKNKAK